MMNINSIMMQEKRGWNMSIMIRYMLLKSILSLITVQKQIGLKQSFMSLMRKCLDTTMIKTPNIK